MIVHHAVEQQILTRYPGLFTEEEIHSLINLRGIPNTINGELHLSQMRVEWNAFYRMNANPTRAQILQKVAEIDARYGASFLPPIK